MVRGSILLSSENVLPIRWNRATVGLLTRSTNATQALVAIGPTTSTSWISPIDE